MAYKIVMQYPDGTTEEDDEVFENEADAEEHGIDMVSSFRVGGEVLHMSNPGDYPLRDESADFEIIEVDD